MLSEFAAFIYHVCYSALNMLNSASVWMVISFAIAGALHEFLSPEKMKKSSICSSRISGVFWVTVFGMLIPICSCGTIPLGISLYYSGAYLGPTLAFMTSSPMINPIAVILCWGLLGKEITIIYVITGFVAPMLIGMAANRFGGSELHLPGIGEQDGQPAILLEEEAVSFKDKLLSGLKWSFTLGNPGIISLFGITVVAALMYVCAVGHIPFIAALVASGAAPGVAITFLMAGASTNIPELLTINRTIGKRAMIMYFFMVTVISNIVGYITNQLLMPGFKPVLDYDASQKTIRAANKLIFTAPLWLKYLCSFVLIAYACVALVRIIKKQIGSQTAELI